MFLFVYSYVQMRIHVSKSMLFEGEVGGGEGWRVRTCTCFCLRVYARPAVPLYASVCKHPCMHIPVYLQPIKGFANNLGLGEQDYLPNAQR